jgi:hypothetical protein
VTALGRPRSVYRRAIEAGNLVVAEAVIRELGRVTLADALDLCVLAARKDRKRASRYAVRWLQRLLEERPLTVEEAALAATALAALGGPGHDAACAALYDLVPNG